MSKIELREPPLRAATGRRPLMPLDQKILALATGQAMRPVAIARALNSHPSGEDVSTQRVASRLKSLVQRGLAERIRPPGAPANGPGTSLYRAKPQAGHDGG